MQKIEISEDFECPQGCKGCPIIDTGACFSFAMKQKGKTIYIADKNEELYTQADVDEIMREMVKRHGG